MNQVTRCVHIFTVLFIAFCIITFTTGNVLNENVANVRIKRQREVLDAPIEDGQTVQSTPQSSTEKTVQPTAQSSTEHPGNRSTYNNSSKLDGMLNNALQGWYRMTNCFLNWIKPPNTYDVINLITEYTIGNKTMNSENVKESIIEILELTPGLITCIAIGFVYIIVMIVFGLIFCCCRCCNKCGGKRYQKQTEKINSWRTCYGVALFLLNIILVIALICMFFISERTKNLGGEVEEVVIETSDNFVNFIEDVNEDVSNAVGIDLDSTIEKLNGDLENYGTENLLGVPIKDKVKEDTKNVIDAVWNFVNVSKKAAERLKNISAVMSDLVTNSISITTLLKDLRTETEHLIKQCDSCSHINEEVPNDIDFTTLSKVKEYTDETASKFENTAMKNDIEKINERTENIPKEVIESSYNDRATAKERLKNIKNDIQGALSPELKNVSVKIKNETTVIKEYASSYKENYSDYVFWGFLSLTILLLLPIVFLQLGLYFGMFGHKKDRYPYERTSLSHCGGICLLTTAYFYLIFCSILMLILMGLFLIGGSVKLIVCNPLYEDDLSTLDKITNRSIEYYLQRNGDSGYLSTLVPSYLLHECKDNNPAFKALKLEEVFDMKKIKNMTTEVQDKVKIDDINVKLENIINVEQMEKDIEETLELVLNIKGNEKLLKGLQLGTTINELNRFAEALKSIVTDKNAIENMTADLSKKTNDLKVEVRKMDEEKNVLEDAMLKAAGKIEVDGINATAKEQFVSDLKGTLALLTGDAMKAFIKQKVDNYVKRLLIHAEHYTENIEQKINTTECKPIWDSYDALRSVACVGIIEPLNGYWFGLGWWIILFIPTFIITFKLSKHYLKMIHNADDEDNKDNMEMMGLGYRKGWMTSPTLQLPVPRGYLPNKNAVHPYNGSPVKQVK